MPQTNAPLGQRRAFTLTELLVVIAIIAMLVALVSVGVMRAMDTAKATRIKTELDQIDSAMKAYKEKFGSYPPTNLAFNQTSGGVTAAERARRLAVVKQHLAVAFPRYNASQNDPSNNRPKLENDLKWAGIDLENIRPDQALVFWLRGFSPNPLNPILSINNKQIENNSEVGTPIKRANAFFEFDATRLLGVPSGTAPSLSATNPAPSYFPNGIRTTSDATGATVFPVWQSGGAPIVYFDSSFYEFVAPDYATPLDAQPNTFNTGSFVPFQTAGAAAPYWLDRNNNGSSCLAADQNSQETWANPDSFQLIACGNDGKYGQAGLTPPMPKMFARMYPSGKYYDPAQSDDDNATNFSSKARIGDDRP
jgi:prepilin-type N-terminal cleavage/methylation domain-containing protein